MSEILTRTVQNQFEDFLKSENIKYTKKTPYTVQPEIGLPQPRFTFNSLNDIVNIYYSGLKYQVVAKNLLLLKEQLVLNEFTPKIEGAINVYCRDKGITANTN